MYGSINYMFLWQFVLTFVNLLWLALLYIRIKKLNKSK